MEELFLKAAKHLLKQNAQSMSDGMCLYRGPCGRMCAVGAIITEEAYHPSIEGVSVEIEEVRIALYESLGRRLSTEELTMLRLLQYVHDKHSPAIWLDELTKVAKELQIDVDLVKLQADIEKEKSLEENT